MTHPTPPHSVRAHLAISLELTRLILGGRGPRRPELENPLLDDRTRHRTKRPNRRKR